MVIYYHVPVEWIFAQGGGCINKFDKHLGLYEAFDRGEQGRRTAYAKEYLPGLGLDEQGRDRALRYRRKLHFGSFDYDLPLPATLTKTGRYELLDGHHRATRHVFAGRITLPIEVKRTSPLWTYFIGLLNGINGLTPSHRGRLYQSIEHPFFDSWEVDRGDERLSLVSDFVSKNTSENRYAGYLEIGSCTGRITRTFERLGWYCFGVEIDPVVLSVAEYLDFVFDTKIQYSNGDYREFLTAGQWGVVVCLSVFHRQWVEGNDRDVRDRFLEMMKWSRLVITDQERPGLKIGNKTAPSAEEYYEWLRSIMPLSHRLEKVGNPDGRPIYAFVRN